MSQKIAPSVTSAAACQRSIRNGELTAVSFTTDDNISAIAITSSNCHLGCKDSFNKITWSDWVSWFPPCCGVGAWSLLGTAGESSDGSSRWCLGLLCNESHLFPWVCCSSDGWESSRRVSRGCNVPWKVCQLFLAPAMMASSFTGSHNGVEGTVKRGGTKVM